MGLWLALCLLVLLMLKMHMCVGVLSLRSTEVLSYVRPLNSLILSVSTVLMVALCLTLLSLCSTSLFLVCLYGLVCARVGRASWYWVGVDIVA